jgi:hypothetical protein
MICVLIYGLLVICGVELCSAQTTSSTPINSSPQSSRPPNVPALVVEYDRAIFILNFGVHHHWKSRQEYLVAFERLDRHGTSGEVLEPEYQLVSGLLKSQLPSEEHHLWDERLPYDVSVEEQTLRSFTFARDRLWQADCVRSLEEGTKSYKQ